MSTKKGGSKVHSPNNSKVSTARGPEIRNGCGSKSNANLDAVFKK